VCLVDPRHLRFCPSCARRGFHTALYDLLLVARCPIHGERLVDACPLCGETILTETTRGANSDPYACRCGHVLWPSIRSPAFSTSQIAALRSAIDWLDRNAQSISSSVDGFTIHDDDFGDSHSIIVSEAIRYIVDACPDAPAFVARPKSFRAR
jgi:predicted RNA-binding Zn-ribbon protein involved in translation (DUF1610 family)